MPVHKCNGKYRIGSGPCVFDTPEKAQKAYRGYLFKKHGAKASVMEGVDIPCHIGLRDLAGVRDEMVALGKKAKDDTSSLSEVRTRVKGPMIVQSVIATKEQFPTRDRAVSRVKNMGYKVGDVEETKDSWRFRQRAPGEFIPGTFRTKEIADGISLVMGKLKK